VKGLDDISARAAVAARRRRWAARRGGRRGASGARAARAEAIGMQMAFK